MFNNVKEINLACPSCKSTNINIGRNLNAKPNDTVRCNDCSYSQFAQRFIDQWKIENRKKNS